MPRSKKRQQRIKQLSSYHWKRVFFFGVTPCCCKQIRVCEQPYPGQRNITDSTYLSDFGKQRVVNLNELSKLDSRDIRKYLFPSKHQHLYKGETVFNKSLECEVRDMLYYIQHLNDIIYNPGERVKP